MTRRYKGRLSGKTIAREFPFIVEIAVPPGGAQFTRRGQSDFAISIVVAMGRGLSVPHAPNR